MPRADARTFAALCCALALVCLDQGARAQAAAAARTAPLASQVPPDPSVRSGTFDNGLRYYIRRNTEPRNRAYLRLVVNVGSLHENADERGIAHFLEHMAFNGTEHFEKQALVRFMESIGMRLGPGINASTSFDQTIYRLSVPTEVPKHLEIALQIIEDWIQGVTLDPTEVELERGVVLEEWRGTQGAQSRVRDQHLPVLLNGSRYAQRLPIGTAASINAIDADKLRGFYRTWYRPDRMAVIVIGDFDAAAIERLVRDRFGKVSAAAAASPAAPPATVPGHAETLFSIVTDPEVPGQSLQIVHKLPAQNDATHEGFRQRLVRQLGNTLLSLRLQERALQPEAPFLAASAGFSRQTRTIETHTLAATVVADGVERGLAGLQREVARIARHGFTETELERGRATLLRMAQLAGANRDRMQSESFANAYTEAFLTGVPQPAIDYEVALFERFVPDIGLAEINTLAHTWLDDRNRVVLVTLPRKDDIALPRQESLAAVLAATRDADVERYVDAATPAALVAAPPRPAPVVMARERAGGLIEWELGNGVRVVLKPTDFSEDLILVRGILPGGTSLADDDELVAAQTAAAVLAAGGVGDLDPLALQRTLTGKVADVRPFLAEGEVGISGRGSATDLRTLFELIYARFTAPRADPNVYAVQLNQLRIALENRDRNPETRFNDAFNRLLTADHPRARPLTIDRLGEMSLDRSLEFYRERFADATGATFIFVGDIDPERLRPLAEQYLGGLPAAGRREAFRDRGIPIVTGIHQETVRAGREPKSATAISFHGEFEVHDAVRRTLLAATAQLLQTHLREVLREELSGTYGVSVEPRVRWLPAGGYWLAIRFSSAPERAEELLARVFTEIAGLQRQGPAAERVAEVRAALLRSHETNLRRNEHWLSVLTDSYRNERNPGAESLLRYPERVDAATPEAIRDALRRYLTGDHYVRVTLLPAP
ncbi:MAG: insulinase family protein [Gammaproteobacteria bacterium]|nr:insulinase family protein [Gammaproteobacteria bacterium]